MELLFADVAQPGTALALSGKIQDFENFGLRPKYPFPKGFPVQIRALAYNKL
jgi:hypothetical protein